MVKRYYDLSAGGQKAYLIGYIDGYSRYITGLGFYRSQTAEMEKHRLIIIHKPKKRFKINCGD